MNTLEILMRARALIARPNGWCQQRYEDGRGGHCMRGAVHKVEGIAIGIAPPETPAILALRAIHPLKVIAGFNDAPGTTKTDVLAAFDRAIEAEWQKVDTAEPSRPELVSA